MSELRVSLICALLAALGPVALAIYTPALPIIASDLGASTSETQLTVSLFFAGFALAQLICGPLSDGVGRRPALFGFLAIFTLGSGLAVFADTIGLMIVARIAQGLGAAVGIALSRAMVRDLFEGAQGARVQSSVGIVLAIGPTIAPYLGGLLLTFSDWRAIFVFLALVGICSLAVVAIMVRETVSFDLSRIRPASVAASYATVLRSPDFVLPSLIVAGTSGTVYAQATLLPFIMITQVGLTPADFGLAMLLQPIMFILGSVVVRARLARDSDRGLSSFGLSFIALCAAAMPLTHMWFAPSFWTVMLPLSIWGWGVAFVLPIMTTCALQAFPHHSGAAAAMFGFLQMGAGLIGGLLASQFDDPSLALFLMTPAMALVAVISWGLWARRR